MTDKDEKKEQIRVQLKGSGVEGLLGGLGEFLSRIEELAEKGEALEGSKRFGGKGFKGEVRYNITSIKGAAAPRHAGIGIRPGGDAGYKEPTDKPEPVRVERPSSKQVEPEVKPMEPLVDVFDEGDNIMIVASLRDIKDENLNYEIVDNALKITAETAEGKVEKNISIPENSKIDKIKNVSFENGILEIKLSKKKNKKKNRKRGKKRGGN